MISNRIQDESAPKIVDYYDVTEAAWPSSVTNLHVQYLDQMSKRKCQRGCMFVSQKGSGCKAYWWSWYDGPKKSQNTEPLILSNIHFISPIQFDYFSKIISAFFGPCLGFPFKQTSGFQPMGKQTERGPKAPKGAWTGLVWNGVCWSLSIEWNAMCSASATFVKTAGQLPKSLGVFFENVLCEWFCLKESRTYEYCFCGAGKFFFLDLESSNNEWLSW